MKIERLKENINPTANSEVTVKRMGTITEVRHMTNEVGGIIRKLDKDNYMDIRTGEVKEFQHTELRVENLAGISRSLRDLRDIINANCSKPKNCLWVTLTYAENMTDPKRLYDDFRTFNMRFQRYLKRKDYPACEYIAAAEPQARGAWHLHCILIFPKRAPFVANDELFSVWGHGFTKTTALKGVDNIGVYLTAYLGDMELTEAFGEIDLTNSNIKEVKVTDEQGKKRNKAIVKGARLRLYPVGFRIYRCSRGIKKPDIIKCTEAEAMQEIGSAKLTFEKTISVIDTELNTVVNTINYRHYNAKAKRTKNEYTENE